MEIKKLKMLIKFLERDLAEEVLKNKKLAEEIARSEQMNCKLQQAITSKLLPVPETPFKDCEDFLDSNTLTQFSLEANSDYIFMKFLMMRLWPEGLVGRSVTGRQSNNPSGRPKVSKGDGTPDKSSESESNDFGETSSGVHREEDTDGISHVKIALEKDKVDYCIRKCISIFFLFYASKKNIYYFQAVCINAVSFCEMMQTLQKFVLRKERV